MLADLDPILKPASLEGIKFKFSRGHDINA